MRNSSLGYKNNSRR